MKMKKVSLIGIISAFITVSTLTVAVLAASATTAESKTDENKTSCTIEIGTKTPQQDEIIYDEPGVKVSDVEEPATSESGAPSSATKATTVTLQQNGNISEEPGISPQSGSFTIALELMQSTCDWSYIESYLPNMPNEGIDFIVNIYNSKQPNSAEHKKASDYYNTVSDEYVSSIS